MKKSTAILGIIMSFFIVTLLILMIFGKDIEILNGERVFTPDGLGYGVFPSWADFLIYNVFIIGLVLSIVWICYSVAERKK